MINRSAKKIIKNLNIYPYLNTESTEPAASKKTAD